MNLIPGSDLLGLVTISSFTEQVTILATKTQPKKLVLIQFYWVRMVKGILIFSRAGKICDMQELCSFSAFASCEWNATCANTQGHSLAVHYYSVTPISWQACLIQWVDNLISMYSVFMYSNLGSSMHSMLSLNLILVVLQLQTLPSHLFHVPVICSMGRLFQH